MLGIGLARHEDGNALAHKECGASLRGVDIHGVGNSHRHALYRYAAGKDSTANTKELQSAVVFFTQNKLPADKGYMWRNSVGRSATANIIIRSFRALEGVTGVKVHRICKTEYAICTLIANHMKELSPFLSSFMCTYTGDVQRSAVGSTQVPKDPIKQAAYLAAQKKYNPVMVGSISQYVAAWVGAQMGIAVQYVVMMRDAKGSPHFVLFEKVGTKIVAVKMTKQQPRANDQQ